MIQTENHSETAFRDTDIKEIAKRVRADIARAVKSGQLPQLKVSVRLQRFAGGQSLSVYVTAVPEGFAVINAEHVRWQKDNPHRTAAYDAPPEAQARLSQQALAVESKLDEIVSAYHWDRSDTQVDYFNVNFFKHVGFHWELEREHRERLERGANSHL